MLMQLMGGVYFLRVDYDGGPAAASENASLSQRKLITHDQLCIVKPFCVVFFLILQHNDLSSPPRLHMW